MSDAGLSALDPAATDTFRRALAEFVDVLTANFASSTAAQPEDQLKDPVQALIGAAGAATERPLVTRTEIRVDGLGGRPDIGVDADGLLVGHVELKAPGTGANPTRFRDRRSRDQWEQFKALPNLIYTDGKHWALYRSGELVGSAVTLPFDPTDHTGAAVLTADAGPLLDLLATFLRWDPVVPSTPRALAAMLAPLTRLLRNEVLADVQANGVMAQLAGQWRATLFPDADDPTFADSYAQTFTYALLLARLEGATSPLDAERAAIELDNDHALLAQTLRVLGQPAARAAIGLPVDLLQRIIGAVDADRLSRGRDPWLYFYEDFLAAYDPIQRNNRGVYYTPFEVVACQVRLCNHLLVDRLGRNSGFGDPSVVVLDPAVGTGTYPLTVIATALEQAVDRYGPGIAPQVATQLAQNVNAFELLVGPYAVSHLRISRTLADAGADLSANSIRVFLTDTLAVPQHDGFASRPTLFEQKLVEEQERASRVKSGDTSVTVVIGNPPYDRDTSGTSGGTTRRKGGMVRHGENGGIGLLSAFLDALDPRARAEHSLNLYNDYVYFWRWALWRVCEQGDEPGIVSFITASSYLAGPGFAGMRTRIREAFDEVWIIDLGGEGHGARQEANVFDGIRTPVAIALAVRAENPLPTVPAVVRYRRLRGTRDEKLTTLASVTSLDPNDDDWDIAGNGWSEPFTPAGQSPFDGWPRLNDVLPWTARGTQFSRSWPIGEAKSVLNQRWETLVAARAEDRPALLRESRDARCDSGYRSFKTGQPSKRVSELADDDVHEGLERIAFRSFDRQWCIADRRVIDMPRPPLWATVGTRQVFLTTLQADQGLAAGPGVVASAAVPDLNSFNNRGGMVLPLYRGDGIPNITPGLLELLADRYGYSVTAEDLGGYVMGLLGTAAYVAHFEAELEASSPRVPFTADAHVFAEVAAFGKDLLWWSTFGERFQPSGDGPISRRLPSGRARNTVAVPITADSYPDTFSYDHASETIHVGDGEFGPVGSDIWDFEVSGLKVVQSWLAYRMKRRAGRSSSELDRIRPATWSFSDELVELLAVIEHFVNAAPRAAGLIQRVVDGNLIDPALFPVPSATDRQAPTRSTGAELTLDLGD